MHSANDLASTERQSPTVVAVVEECFNYAAWQNAVPLIRSVVVDNPTDRELSSVVVEMNVTPAFCATQMLEG